MPRKVERITIEDEGRDKGKIFVLTEMPASQAQKWATRALLAVSNSGAAIAKILMMDISPDEKAEMIAIETKKSEEEAKGGMALLAEAGFEILSRIPEVSALTLMDELFTCVQIQPDPSKTNIVRPLIEDDVEEIITRFKLHMEVFQLHAGFSLAGATSKLISAKPSAV